MAEKFVHLHLLTSADGLIHLGAYAGHLCSTGIQLVSSDEALQVGDQRSLWQLPSSCALLPKVQCFLLWSLCLLVFLSENQTHDTN